MASLIYDCLSCGNFWFGADGDKCPSCGSYNVRWESDECEDYNEEIDQGDEPDYDS